MSNTGILFVLVGILYLVVFVQHTINTRLINSVEVLLDHALEDAR